MATTGSVSGGASYARGSGYRADRTNNHRPHHHSGGLLTPTKFIDKTTEMNSKIFDVGSGQGYRFLSTQDEIPKSAIYQPKSQNIDTPANDICVVVNNTSTKEANKKSGSRDSKYQGWWCHVLDMEKHGRVQLKVEKKDNPHNNAVKNKSKDEGGLDEGDDLMQQGMDLIFCHVPGW